MQGCRPAPPTNAPRQHAERQGCGLVSRHGWGVDYFDTLIAIADDCPVQAGTDPPADAANLSVAARQFAMIMGRPYHYTSADVIFAVYADRAGIPEPDRAAARAEFYARPQPCLRSSPLGKRYGWGIHADATGRIAVYGADSENYRRLSQDLAVRQLKAMRSSRAR